MVGLVILIFLLVGMAAVVVFFGLKKVLVEHWKMEVDHLPAPQVHTIDLKPLEREIASVPGKVLQSIQGSVNAQKGALGELIGYIQLNAEYDRIIPLGNVVDFLAIRFPTDTKPGKIVFIDIKTGKAKRLSKEQKAVRELIENKQIEFLKFAVTTSTTEENHGPKRKA